MRNDRFYEKLVLKMQEVSVVPPQNLGLFTPLYRKLVPQFKFFPLKALVPLSFLFILGAYLLFGTLMVRLAEILQTAF